MYNEDREISANFGDADGRVSSPVSDDAQSVNSLNLDKFQSSKVLGPAVILALLAVELIIFSAMEPFVCVLVDSLLKVDDPDGALEASPVPLLFFDTLGFFVVDETEPAESAGAAESLLSRPGVGAVADASSTPSAFCSSCNVVLR